MRDPFGLNERLFAVWYPIVMRLAEEAGQREIRQSVVGPAVGRTLEIGAGNGYNLPHYTDRVTKLVVTEPSPFMFNHLRTALESDPPPVGSWELRQTGAEELPFPDASFDTVVATYVHCTIPNPTAALSEIDRVLRPGGRYLFLEHVRAPEGSMLGRVQDLVEIPHRYICAGCHPDRRTAQLLEASALKVEELEFGTMPMTSPTVRPIISGVARSI